MLPHTHKASIATGPVRTVSLFSAEPFTALKAQSECHNTPREAMAEGIGSRGSESPALLLSSGQVWCREISYLVRTFEDEMK